MNEFGTINVTHTSPSVVTRTKCQTIFIVQNFFCVTLSGLFLEINVALCGTVLINTDQFLVYFRNPLLTLGVVALINNRLLCLLKFSFEC